jgi:hypothetical protein
MSPRAAWRLQDLGFERVYDYVPGKADWFASGLPREGKLASIPTVGDVARPEVPTCSPKEKASNARDRTREAGFPVCSALSVTDWQIEALTSAPSSTTDAQR